MPSPGIEPTDRVTMCRKTRELDGTVYDVEIAISRGRLLLSVQSKTSSDTIVVEIPADKSTLLTRKDPR